MSNPWAQSFEELRSPYLQEKMAKKDYDGDGKIESGKDEYMGSKDKAIKKAMGKKVEEHHQKDADGKVIEHDDTTPSSVEERASITAHDVNYGTKAGKDFMSGAKNAAGELKYKLKPAGGMRIRLANRYEPKKSNWREDFVWQDEVEEAIKRPKLDIQEKGVKNKIEVNPDDGLKEEKKN